MVLAVVFVFSVPVFVDRQEYAVAVSNLVKESTLANGLAVEKERLKNRRVAFITHLAATGVLFVLINLSWSLLARRSAPDGSPR